MQLLFILYAFFSREYFKDKKFLLPETKNKK